MGFDYKKTLNGINWKQLIIILFFISVAFYFYKNHHPAIAGMVAVMPIALATFIFAKDENLDIFAFSMGLGLASYSISAFAFYYFIHHKKFSRMQAILWSMLLWILLICVFYYVFTDGPSIFSV